PILVLGVYLPLLLFFNPSSAQHSSASSKNYWQITNRQSILWQPKDSIRLPHADHIEMAGKKVAAIIDYSLDENRYLSLQRDVIFPQLRTYNKSNEPDWKKYRAYFRRQFSDELLPSITLGEKRIMPGPVDSVEINGKLTFYHQAVAGLRISRTLYPAMESRYLVEHWRLENQSGQPMTIYIGERQTMDQEKGYKGVYYCQVFSDAQSSIRLAQNSTYQFGLYFTAQLNEEDTQQVHWESALKERDAFLQKMQSQLVLKSPNPIINQLFYFSKIRAAENIFNSSMGLVHSPGGGNYYVGIWANDQIEYSGPFFPFLGYDNGNTAAYNAYKMFLKHIPKDDSHIPYSFEVDGHFPLGHLDRGDAAMIAFGTSQYLLARGSEREARELWPLVEWSLDYCHRQRNVQGVVQSESDEMEGRIPTGTANLSTSALYYGGLKYAIYLARQMGDAAAANLYEKRKKAMAQSIENYFGAEIMGLSTYRYFEDHPYLRHWICLPLVMGISDRKAGTIDALFNHLWTEDGVLVELNPEAKGRPVFWDRGTLYALRGAFKAGAADLSMNRLSAFSEKRLLGDHVPYVIEAYPENNKRHLSAESALYCRIFTEGLLGMEQKGFDRFSLSPHLPSDWEELQFQEIRAFDKAFDLTVKRKGGQLEISLQQGEQVYQQLIREGETIDFTLQ
ncbi:MAG: six-hairpin glycosidase-like protein, partial [Bacteroidota bacterium]